MPDHRHLLFMGDGSFQVTAQELSTILRHDHNGMISLSITADTPWNTGYLGKTSPTTTSPTGRMPTCRRCPRHDTSARSFVVQTREGPARCPQRAERHDDLRRIQFMDPYDALAPVTDGGDEEELTSTTDLAGRNTAKACSCRPRS